MEIRGVRDIQKIVDTLIVRCENLVEAINEKELLDRITDQNSMMIFQTLLNDFEGITIRAESYMYCMMYDIEDMNLDKEINEKILFVIRKNLNSYIKTNLLPQIESIIDIREWEFEDYRVRDWQMDVARKMEMIRDYYKKEYNLD